jgi:hypothetical protein
MAERITYQVSITPGRNTMQNTSLETETDDDLVINDTNVVALRRFVRQIAWGLDVSSVVTAINAINSSSSPVPVPAI